MEIQRLCVDYEKYTVWLFGSVVTLKLAVNDLEQAALC